MLLATLNRSVKRYGFPLALGAIFGIAIALRFWRLGQFNTLVFDEIYYPVFANRYLIGEPVFNSHPPLSQTLMAIAMWIGSWWPAPPDMINGLTGSMRSTLSYRWLNAIAGAWVPIIAALITYHLSQRRSFAITTALLLSLDGLLLVESRYGLNNIYLVLFGLLGHLYLIRGLRTPPLPRIPAQPKRQVRWFRDYRGTRFATLRQVSDWVSDRLRSRRPPQPWQQFSLAGVWFGCAAAVKWNGLGYLFAIALLWIVAIALLWIVPHRLHTAQAFPLNALARIRPLPALLYFALIPLLTYCLLWIPHLWLNPTPNFWQVHRQILAFHHAVGSGSAVHPYCSPWYSWLLMWRPVAYFYATARSLNETVPAYPPLPSNASTLIYDVHAMGNPILWWGATGAIAILLLLFFLPSPSRLVPVPLPWGISLYLLISYAANLLPWAQVSRCTFLYHYMAALIFAEIALAYGVDRWCWQGSWWWWACGCVVLGVSILAFWFWLPIYLGLPLSPDAYQLRMWFANWI
jgi:dolichyl-phosphate-mannose--protein O-mannosyl transferase